MDYKKIYSPVARYDSVRTFLALTTSEGMHVEQFDCKMAYFNGEVEETLYMEQPQGFKDGTNRVYRLKKSLYGLRQAGSRWNEKLVQILLEFSLQATDVDPCVFVKGQGENKLIVIFYVDDAVVASKNRQLVKKFLNI